MKKRHGTTQIHVRVDGALLARLDKWLERTKRSSFGARGAEIERMIIEGIERRERAGKAGG